MTSGLQALIEKLRARNLKIGFAESCTGGLLSATMAAVPGISDVFKGAVVSYDNQVKEDLLGVSRNSLQSEGAVSSAVARQMAQGVRARLKTDWSIAVTGIAGPSGGSEDKPVGTVWFAVAGPEVEVTEKKLFSGARTEIQRQTVDHAVEMINRLL